MFLVWLLTLPHHLGPVLQARYVVERQDGELWDKVLSEENKHRRQLIDQVGGRG